MDPRSSSTLYAGAQNIYRTTNGGTGWTRFSSPAFGGYVTAFAPAPSSTSVFYAGTKNGEVHVTTDGGTTWPDRSAAPFPNRWVTDIAVDDTDARIAYATVSGFLEQESTGHILKTTDAGLNWMDVSGNLPDVPINAVVRDTRTVPATMYVGTDVGVFWSTDDGTTWQNTSSGLPKTVVMDLVLDTAADRIIAATHGRGAWSAPAIKPPSAGGQLLGNAGFENGATIAPWIATNGVITNSANRPPHTGSWYAWMNGYGVAATDTMYQQVSIPAGTTSATLSFWLRINTAETATTANDTLKLQIRNTSGTVLGTLATYSNRTITGTAGSPAYVGKAFDLTPYVGQTIRVYFLGKENASAQTSFVLDDFALTTVP
jgi:hypothetical protein